MILTHDVGLIIADAWRIGVGLTFLTDILFWEESFLLFTGCVADECLDAATMGAGCIDSRHFMMQAA